MTSLTLVRRIKARPSIVFDALTTAEGIAIWWGPDAGPVLVAEIDPQVGGRFRVRFRTLDGSEHESSGGISRSREARAAEHELALDGRRRGSRRACSSNSGFAPSPRGPSSPSPIRACTTRTRPATRQAGTALSTSWSAIFSHRAELRDQVSARHRRSHSHGAARTQSSTSFLPTPRQSQRSIPHDHDLRFQMGSGFAQGQVRDLRARWALEEAGLPYRTRLLEQGDQDKPEYRALQPFGQVPILEEDGLVLFESGAIVLHIGERSETLLPKDAGARARATQWLIAALNSIEPFVMNVALIDLFYANEEWAKLRRPGAVEFVAEAPVGLSKSLGDKPYLDGDRFTAGDLMMTTVLRILKHTDIVTSDKRLAAYVERCTARPAFKRAFDAQIGDFREAA